MYPGKSKGKIAGVQGAVFFSGRDGVMGQIGFCSTGTQSFPEVDPNVGKFDH